MIQTVSHYQAPNYSDCVTRANFDDAELLMELRQDQLHLQELITSVEASLNQRSTTDAVIAQLLNRLQRQLAWHFALEENLGYIEQVTLTAPRLTESLRELQLQHDELVEELTEILRSATAVRRCSRGELVERFAEFRARLRTHDQQENDLIMEAMYVDIGGG